MKQIKIYFSLSDDFNTMMEERGAKIFKQSGNAEFEKYIESDLSPDEEHVVITHDYIHQRDSHLIINTLSELLFSKKDKEIYIVYVLPKLLDIQSKDQMRVVSVRRHFSSFFMEQAETLHFSVLNTTNKDFFLGKVCFSEISSFLIYDNEESFFMNFKSIPSSYHPEALTKGTFNCDYAEQLSHKDFYEKIKDYSSNYHKFLEGVSHENSSRNFLGLNEEGFNAMNLSIEEADYLREERRDIWENYTEKKELVDDVVHEFYSSDLSDSRGYSLEESLKDDEVNVLEIFDDLLVPFSIDDGIYKFYKKIEKEEVEDIGYKYPEELFDRPFLSPGFYRSNGVEYSVFKNKNGVLCAVDVENNIVYEKGKEV